MTIALRSPQLVEALIPVDNSPIDAALQTDFHSYLHGMQKVEEAKVKKQADADKILKDYEEVSSNSLHMKTKLTPSVVTNTPISSH